jgi:hypothetical protein
MALVQHGFDCVRGEKNERTVEHVEYRLPLGDWKEIAYHGRNLLPGKRFAIEACERVRHSHTCGSRIDLGH